MNSRLFALAIIIGWPIFVICLAMPMLQDFVSPLAASAGSQLVNPSLIIIIEGFVSMLGIGLGSVAWAAALPELIFGSKFLN